MKKVRSMIRAAKKRGAAILEYVIIAVGIAIFCTFGILMFGKAAQEQMNAATGVLAGSKTANDKNIHKQAQDEATKSNTDAARVADKMSRE